MENIEQNRIFKDQREMEEYHAEIETEKRSHLTYEQKMDAETKKEMDEWVRLIKGRLDNLEKAVGLRFDSMAKVISDYLELSSNLSMATVKANLKNV